MNAIDRILGIRPLFENYQVSVPTIVRRKLELNPSDKIEFIERDGLIFLRKQV